MTNCQWLYLVEPGQEDHWGQEAVVLAEAARTGVPVLPGFVVAAPAVTSFFMQPSLKKAITAAIKPVLSGSDAQLHAHAKEVRTLVAAADLPEKLAQDISAFLVGLEQQVMVTPGKGFPVTLSLLNPDLGLPSYTQLVKTTADAITLVKKYLSLLFSDQALHSRLRSKDAVVPGGLALLVQFAPAVQVAGVAYAYDFQQHDDSTIVVQGHQHETTDRSRVSADDEYRVDRKTLLLLSRNLSKQHWKAHRSGKHSATSGGVLSDEQAIHVARMVKRAQAALEDTMCFHWCQTPNQHFISRIEPFTQEIEAQQRGVVSRSSATMPLLRGLPGNLGLASGPVRILKKGEQTIERGDVVVLLHAPHGDISWLLGAAALVFESGHQAAREAQVARMLGVPAVLGVGAATRELKNGQVVTVDGSQGLLFAGVRREPALGIEPAQQTGTKLYATVIDPAHATRECLGGFDGVGLLRSEFILRLIGIHPQEILNKKLHAEYIELLAEGIEQAIRAVYPKPLVYQLHDIESAELLGWRERHHDRYEPNPKLGYRGTHRLLAEPELLDLELQALAVIRAKGLESFSIMLPMVRSLEEIDQLRTRVGESALGKYGEIGMWVKCETPALLIRADELAQLPIDGVCFNVPQLAQLISGIDLENYQVAHHLDRSDIAVEQALRYAIATCRAAGIETTLVSEMETLSPELLEAGIESGLTGVCVVPKDLESTRSLVGSIEKRLLLDHLLAD